ncbi:putative E3 ubiquitin-protein ligase XBAT31 isoform X2 [Olea europaea var. sylvestris]|uniref:RING-type E3 ubiquitin transferase n=1 Tax=Olea europaea subsp. europaea TaxID=158383 RepID=A0A8S0R7G5_OLEEU|nr:putative E3 ubiquitin-protein ligase XBAT31 isoform X2 [Olea europaea var. sylvestris]CAA2974253.1 E3 ubiquitin- ligase XBAT31 [Olea europaea subsp. europaea]
MGQGLSCGQLQENDLFVAVQTGEIETVEAMADENPNLLTVKTVHGKLSALHVAAANGQIEVLSVLLDRCSNPDILNRHKQTPLMLAAMHGNISCVGRLVQAGANILLFDTLYGRTCLHYAAYYGHSDCLQLILSSAHSTPVAHSWGFSRFVNIRDGRGATALHLAARQRQRDCVRVLLSSGALASASTGGYSYPGSTPLHLAARGGSLDCVRELLAWGADRLQRDSSGRIPYMVAVKHKHDACAALLNPLAPEPLTWPSSLKFINELNPEAKSLLEKALIEANKKREKAILMEKSDSNPQPSSFGGTDDDFEVNDAKLCCICFEHECTIEVQECRHEMCAHCTLALCCHNKPNSAANSAKIPLCPFCRTPITRLVVAKNKIDCEMELEFSSTMPRRTRKSFNLGEGSSSFKSLSSLGSFGRLGRGSGKVGDDCNEFDKT